MIAKFILDFFEAANLTRKYSGKWNMIDFNGAQYPIKIFILLIKGIAVYIEFSQIFL